MSRPCHTSPAAGANVSHVSHEGCIWRLGTPKNPKTSSILNPPMVSPHFWDTTKSVWGFKGLERNHPSSRYKASTISGKTRQRGLSHNDWSSLSSPTSNWVFMQRHPQKESIYFKKQMHGQCHNLILGQPVEECGTLMFPRTRSKIQQQKITDLLVCYLAPKSSPLCTVCSFCRSVLL